MQTANDISGLIILFGFTGDLSSRNIIPALYRLYRRNILSERFAIIGTGRTKEKDLDLEGLVRDALADEIPDRMSDFLEHVFYQRADVTQKADYELLKDEMQKQREAFDIAPLTIYHLSISPALFADATTLLAETGITSEENGEHRIIIEKPFGDDTESARQLNADINEHFNEEQIYRIDHYLGMEMVQNVIAVRHYNPFIKQLWNKNALDNIQITFKEDQTIGSRGEYYDAYGAFLDLFQNHILQMIALTGMEDPKDLTPKAIHDAKVDFLKSVSASDIVLGQYEGYRDEIDVATDSQTDTYFAGKLMSEDSRFENVPFYFRHGKGLDETFAVISLVLKDEGNRITFYVRPHEGVKIVVNQKAFGQKFSPVESTLQAEPVGEYEATEYEKLIFDVLRGDKSFFVTWEEIEQQWRITDSIRKHLATPKFPNYKIGERGPQAADELLERDGRVWVEK